KTESKNILAKFEEKIPRIPLLGKASNYIKKYLEGKMDKIFDNEY
ncbi:22190_t:CDS:1, partial [Dentiscutata erythropus]